MHFDWSTLALQTVNFAVLVWLLRRFLYKPVLALIDARRAEVAGQYAGAAKVEAEAKANLARSAADRDGIAKEREEALKAAAVQAEQIAGTRRTLAQQEATGIVEAGRKAIAEERAQARAEMRNAAFDLGLEIAERLLAEVPTELRAEAWLERIEEHVEKLSPAERSELRDGAAAGKGLRVVTAVPLPDATKEEWCVRLSRVVSEGMETSFDVDPTLIAGAELHFPTTVLRFSWQSAVATMRAEIETDAHAR